MSYLCGERRIALVNLPQSVEHFGQLWWIHWLHCDLDDWCCVELQRPKNLSLKGRVKKNMRIWIWLFFYFSKTLGIFFCRSPTSSFPLGSVIVAVLTIGWSQPSMRTQLPAGTRFTSIWYLKIVGWTEILITNPWFATKQRIQALKVYLATEIQRRPTVQTWESSSSSSV